ncbi:adenosylcobinamide-phosphate synthase CbiB [Senegalia sp. (in: firmicutes)]|uniref:adenosylcobinamide-phosphate synthase CbiB n=1 Tax=Senegalia sp. (in: firmicutes) TaxID=1924098 RepID=UPI003F95175D
MTEVFILLSAIILDFLFGDPYNIPHPIIYIGKLISYVEERIRKSNTDLKKGGALLLILVLSTVFISISLILFLANVIHPIFKTLITIYLLYTSLAAKCLKDEGIKIYKVLKEKDIKKARLLISYLVGRDTEKLEEDEITRATIETIAENTIDGVLAPIFYIFIGFLLGMPVQFVFLYKAINTLDSMVGYINEKYKDIGYFSAKVDDLVNFIPARIGAVFMILGGFKYDMKNGFKILIRDRLNHKSPNAAYPESAVAGLLNIQIGGENIYFGEKIYKPTIGDKNRKIIIEDIKRTINIMYISEILFVVFIIFILLYII